MDTNQKLNAISRLIILLTLVGYVCFNRYIIFILGLILLGVVVIIEKSGKKEGFKELDNYNISNNNPVENVLLTDYKYNKEKAIVDPLYDTEREKGINETAKKFILEENKDNKDISKLFSNLGDELEFEQSLRPFYTNPVSSVDQNEHKNYLKFICGTMPSNKPLQIY